MPRDPYPFPQNQNDNDFSSVPKQVKIPYNRQGTEDAQQEAPWNRLYETKTLASGRREVFHHDPQAPHDSLDFVIKSKYDHHKEFLKSNSETLYQPETLGLPHGRILKNRMSELPAQEKDKSKNPLTIAAPIKKEDINSINGAIPSHHSAATNRGYSRKHDGGFYNC